jgi:hypothetical protein
LDESFAKEAYTCTPEEYEAKYPENHTSGGVFDMKELFGLIGDCMEVAIVCYGLEDVTELTVEDIDIPLYLL